ncbi:MAG: MATE family efflux transporter [Muribaculaceae bacterium]|nr:MATE family efflux transporter [Muribaculaceae bacterium]
MSLIPQKYKEEYLRIIRLGLPILIGQVGMIVVGFADNIMVGRYSTEALASASFVNGIFNTAIFACIGFTYGLTPLVGALFAQKKDHSIGRLMKAGVLLNVLFALLVTGIMTAIYFNLDRLGQPHQLLPLIRPYFVLYLFGIVPIALFNAFAQWSYGIKDSSTPMWIILGANALNIFGNWLFIYGNLGFPEMGLTGAGISTLVARLICPVVLVLIFFMRRRNRGYAEGFRQPAMTSERLRTINRTSWPVSMQSAMESGSFSVAALMAGWLGALELASFQVIIVLSTLGFSIYYSIGVSISVLVANAKGEGDVKAMRHVAMSGYHVILTLTAITCLTYIILGRHLVGFFTEDEAVIALTVTAFVPLIAYQLGDATQITFASALRGTAHVMPMLWIAFISYVVVGIPATYILAFPVGLGLYGLILSFSVSLFLAAGLFLFFFLRTTSGRRAQQFYS